MKIYQLIALWSTLLVAYALASWIVIKTDYPYKGYFWLSEFALLGASAISPINIHTEEGKPQSKPKHAKLNKTI